MTRLRWTFATLFGACVGALVPSLATAEIYGWVDASGAVTYSNLRPPKDAKVIDVIEEAPPPTPQAQAAAEAAHRAEMRALNEKVRQLEQEMQLSRAQSSQPPPPYPPAPPSYGPPPYDASYGPPPYDASYAQGCDPDFFDCGPWGVPLYYTGVSSFGFRQHDRDRFRHDHGRDGFHHGFGHFPRPVAAPRFAGSQHVSSFSGGHGATHMGRGR